MCPSLSSLRADAFFRAAAEQHAVRQDDRHHAVVLQVVQPVQQEGEVGRALGRHAVVLEPHVLAHRLGRLPAIAERRVGDDRVELRLLRRVRLAQHVPVVGQRVAVVDLELRVLHPVQQHVHARQVVGGDVLFLPVDLADARAAPMRWRTFSSSEPEPQAKSNTLSSRFRLPVFGSWLSSVTMPERMLGNLLRRVELARLLARPGRELADQVFVGIAQRVDVGRELRQPLGDLADDRAELGVAVGVRFARACRRRG